MRIPADQLPELPSGRELGNYRIVAPLDIDAGISRSYLAEHRLFARKVIISQLSWGDSLVTQERFLRWLSLVERLQHSHILGLLDCGEHAGFPYAVVPYVGDRTLLRVVEATGRIDLLTCLRLFQGLAEALAHCHRRGVAHRNLNPENVLIGTDGTAYLRGLEIATGLHGDPVELTNFMVSPQFCAPEVWEYERSQKYQRKSLIQQQEQDQSSQKRWFPSQHSLATADVWSFGLILHFALTGAQLVADGPIEQVRDLILDGRFQLEALREVCPAAVVRLIECCVQRSLSLRYKDGSDLARALAALSAHVEEELSGVRVVYPEIGRSVLVFAEPPARIGSGRYLELDITERLGAGAFSEVFRADLLVPGSEESGPLALKVLRREQSQDPSSLERFRREARLLSRLRHMNVVRVVAFGELGDTLFILMDLLDGVTLEHWMAENLAAPWPTKAALVAQIASGLAAMHEAELIHRDLKPANIMVTQAGQRAVITDFGLARAADLSKLTESRHFLGTPAYAAPEQLLGEPLTAQADLYALGVIFFELLSGAPPYPLGSFPALLLATNTKPAPSIRELAPDVPEAIANLIAQLLERSPALRLASAAAVREALVAVAGEEPESGSS